ncbi:MAG: AAA family ATPase [Gemmatimonadetes bacterium]|nr:AAA family ATPase [Gemmatimonadota bacterium]
MELNRRFFNLPQGNVLLLGARGTGKSTWVRNQLPDSIHLDMESPSLRRNLMARPERLNELLADAPGCRSVVVDEIQHAPRLFPFLDRILKEQSPRRFIFTTSCARMFGSGDASFNSNLARYTLHPLLACEVRDFDLDRALRFGTLPGSVAASDPAGVVGTYGQRCLAEVISLGRTRHFGRFSRFLRAIGTSHTLRLNIARVARECAAERKVVAAYIAILEDLLLAFRLPVFQGRPQSPDPASGRKPRRATVARDKLFLFDTGFFRALLPPGGTAGSAEVERQALAGLVVQQIRAWAAYSRRDVKLCYWRTRAGTEIDVVVDGSDGTVGFKVTNSDEVGAPEFRALRAFRRDYPDAGTAILYRGRKHTLEDGTRCLPVAEFLQAVRPGERLAVRPWPVE